VLDTNLLVRLLITPHGVTGRLLDALVSRSFELATSELLLDELTATLQYPRLQKYGPFSARDLQRITGILRRLAVVVPGHYTVLDKVPSDVKDNMVVACAIEAEADHIVTDDRRDLLPLKSIRFAGYPPVQIVSPTAFLRFLSR
jgi:putative PIN family toxin of toxin-antitoxin system